MEAGEIYFFTEDSIAKGVHLSKTVPEEIKRLF